MLSTVKCLVAGLLVLASILATSVSYGAVQGSNAQDAATSRIEVRVGLHPKGWSVEPVNNVEVRLFHTDDPLVTLGAATSDAEGGASFDVATQLIELDDNGKCRLRCEPLHPGFLRMAVAIRAVELEDSAAPVRYAASVTLTPGATQRIRVLGADKDARCMVQVSRWESTELETRRGEMITRRVLKRVRNTSVHWIGGGLHHVHFHGDIHADLLLVKALGRGTGVVSLPVDSRGFVEPTAGIVDAQLHGAATLAGAILDDTGAPASELRFRYSWAELDRAGLDRRAEPLASTLQAEGLGWLRGAAVTERDGTFRIQGLRPGRYRVTTRSTRAKPGTQSSVELGVVELSAESPPVEFRFQRTLLEVDIQGFGEAEGAPFFPLRGYEPDPLEPSGVLSVYDAGPIGSAPVLASGSSSLGLLSTEVFWRGLSSDARNTMTPIEVFGGRQYLVVVQGQAIEPAPHLVAIPKEGDRVTLTLEPQAIELAARVKVDFSLPSEWHGRGYRRGSIELLIEDAETGVPFAVLRGKDLKELERSFPVPARSVRVVARGMFPRDLGRTETVVSVEPGVETVVPLELRSGGRLRIQMTGRIRDEEIPRTKEEIAGRDRLGRHWSEAWLTLLDAEGREVETVPWSGPGTPLIAWGPRLMESWPLGKTATSEMLPVGAYTLRARLLDRPPLLVPVTITAGETTEVKLAFR
ncbi:MAG: hypothetical protein ACJA0P_002317 [Planctomycetota bacterium]|jgi:hypothetical protein